MDAILKKRTGYRDMLFRLRENGGEVPEPTHR